MVVHTPKHPTKNVIFQSTYMRAVPCSVVASRGSCCTQRSFVMMCLTWCVYNASYPVTKYSFTRQKENVCWGLLDYSVTHSQRASRRDGLSFCTLTGRGTEIQLLWLWDALELHSTYFCLRLWAVIRQFEPSQFPTVRSLVWLSFCFSMSRAVMLQGWRHSNPNDGFFFCCRHFEMGVSFDVFLYGIFFNIVFLKMFLDKYKRTGPRLPIAGKNVWDTLLKTVCWVTGMRFVGKTSV